MTIQAKFKQTPSDFVVEEILGFSAAEEGQHLMLFIEKENQNTADVLQHLSSHFGVHPRCVGYSGLKDKQAITRQYFTVDLAGKDAGEVKDLETDGIRLLSSDYHLRKLKVGVHQANKFTIRLRDVVGDRAWVDTVLANIQTYGLPNYFGAQRFGNNQSNLTQAKALFNGEIRVNNHRKRGMLLSAVRSFLFNEICATRVEMGSWNVLLTGDVAQIEGSGSVFVVEDPVDEDLLQRLKNLQIHPTGALFGAKGKSPEGEAKKIEEQALAQYPELTQGLLKFDAKGMRRALRMRVQDLEWQWQKDDLLLSFTLGRGLFATTIIDALLLEDKTRFPEFIL